MKKALLLLGMFSLSFWVLGDCYNEWVDAAMLLNEADSLNDAGAYSEAQLVYKQVINNYPETVSAETAMKSLLSLEAQLEGDYLSLKNYYQTNSTIAADETLSYLASSLANKCDENMRNYIEAIGWYENVLTDSTTNFNDSIFAAIDLGDLYLKMEAEGEKTIGILEKYRPKSVIEHKLQTDHALSLLPRKTSIEQGLSVPSPIRDLSLAVGNNDTVLLTWNLPDGSETVPMILSWITSETMDGGCTQAGFDDIFGHLYNSSDLRNHEGWKIDSISFYKTTSWTYHVCVWKRSDGESMQLVYSQLAQINDTILDAWCSVALDTTILIEEETDYWFGIRATKEEWQTGGPNFPIPFDRGPAVTGKGDLFMPDLSHWAPMQIGYNAMIKTTLSSASRTGMPSNEQLSCSGYRIYRDGMLIKEIPYSFVTYYTDTEFTKGIDVEYCVTAVYGDEESEPVCATATITGVAEEHEDDGVTLSPNPTTGLVRIKGATANEVRVYNAIGQLLKTVRNANEINLKGLPQGVYMLHITDENGAVATRKLVLE